MACLLDLPNELLLAVVSHLRGAPFPSTIDQASLASLCLSCHHLRKLAEPALYEAIQAPVLPSLDVPEPLEPLCKLVRVVLDRPDLALRVTKISLQLGSDVIQNMKEVPIVRLRSDRDSAIISAVSEMFSVTQPAATGSLTPEELILLLIARLPKVAAIRLQITSRLHKRLMRLLDSFAEGGDFPWPALKTAEIEPAHRSSVAPNLGAFGPLLQWPHLETCSMTFCAKYRTPGFFGNCAPKSLALTEINLHECYITVEALKPWLKACKSLRSFAFSAIKRKVASGWLWMEDMGRDIDQLTPADLFEALEPCRDTLERLDADFHEYYQLTVAWPLRNDLAPNDDLFHEDFHTFKRLQHLSIEYNRLRRYESLPPSLETLRLFECGFTIHKPLDINAFAKLKKDTCPRLKSVRLYGVNNFDEVIRGQEPIPTGLNVHPELGFKLDVLG